jgi:glutamate-ammonia-ligase adenylyltransferase
MAARLAVLGFADTDRAERLLTSELGLDPAGPDARLLTAIAAAADPDLALATLARLVPDGQLLPALRADAELRARLLAVLGVSAALGNHLERHPGTWRLVGSSGRNCWRRVAPTPPSRSPLHTQEPPPPARCARLTGGACCGWRPRT